jgi:hypothetical protein
MILIFLAGFLSGLSLTVLIVFGRILSGQSRVKLLEKKIGRLEKLNGKLNYQIQVASSEREYAEPQLKAIH